MSTNKSRRALTVLFTLVILFSMFSSAVMAAPSAAPAVPVSFSILHTNDFHGQLEPSGSNPGSARVATYVNSVRAALTDSNMLLVDDGDEMQGSLLSNLGDGTPTGKGMPTIAVYNAMSYDVATFGNHEFDWGQDNLAARTTQAAYPYVTANIVKNDTGDCTTAGWTKPDFADAPYQIFTMGADPNTVKVAFIGVTTPETPTITIASATAGLCFKDAADSIIHYYDDMKAAGADVIVVLSHLGYTDGGYGYGIPVYGDQTLATKLNTASKPVNLIIGGHSHTNLTTATTVGTTKVVQAYYNGRKVGRADVTVGTDGSVAINWISQAIGTGDPQDTTINDLVNSFATDPAYVALINTPIGYAQTDLLRNYNGDSMMGDFVDDAIYNYLNTDADPTSDVDMFFNNSGGIRTDWCDIPDPANPGSYIWSSTALDCNGEGVWAHDPLLLTYGNMFTILPFGNATIVGDMTGAQILETLHQAATLFKGAIQPSGIRYSFFRYSDANPGPQPYGWGAYDVTVYNKTTHVWEPLDPAKTYRVGTNEFLAPAGQDGYTPFKYMTNISYWGDMLDAVNSYVAATYTFANPYKGPDNDGTLDGRITRNGNGDDLYETGEIVPLTVLHHNDSHGNLVKTPYVAYTQLATLIKQERLHNPDRTLLLSSGDNIQGDAMSYYFKTAPTGFTSDGTAIADPALHIQPLIKVFNSMGYDAMTLGNHEFNFGKDVFTSVLGQATFPILQANVADDGSYGLAAATGGAGVKPFVLKTVGPESIKVAILGIGNHRIPNYELPSNIPGLTFSDPIAKAQELSDSLRSTNDVLIALTHIGFTENPSSVEVDANVDTNLAATTNGIDAIIGGHSHTDPSKQTAYSGIYKYLPTIIANSSDKPVVVTQAYRYNSYLGEVVMGMRSNGSGGYDVVSQTGRYLAVSLTGTAEDVDTKALVDPYAALLTTYNNTTVGATTAPIDTMQAFTQETNGANLQADAAVYELSVKHSIPVDFHLSGAMTNKLIATGATPGSPVTLKISDMFAAMPYENSLVVISMNGPQLKTVLERAYRNYYYYKYFPDHGGYSYYTTCMLDTNFGNQIKYNDVYPNLPNGSNVLSLTIGGVPVNFYDASTYYNVSTVNYLAAGSCNFNDGGTTLWPLSQIVADTQYYVRDAVIDYTTFMGTVSPAIEGRLNFVNYPTAISSVIASPNPTNASNVNFTVTFSEPVTGVGAVGDFILNQTGTLTGAYVTGVTGSGTTYTVSVNTGAGSGDLRLDIRASATIYDVDGNRIVSVPYTSGEKYTINKAAPTVASIARANPNPTNLASVDFTATFSGAVKDVDTADFALAGSVAGASITGVTGGPTVYTVSVDTGTGNGTLRLDVPNTATITDLAGNPLTGLPYTAGETYTVDKSLTLTVNSNGAQDGWILESGENSNMGGSLNSAGTTFNLGDAAANKQYRAILSFNTGALPPTATISQVTLRIKRPAAGYMVGNDNPFTWGIGLKADVCKGFFGTTNALQLGDFNYNNVANCKLLAGIFGNTPSANWYSANITNTAFAKINLNGLTQFRLRFAVDDNNDGLADFLKFFSGDAYVTNRPQLIIKYMP